MAPRNCQRFLFLSHLTTYEWQMKYCTTFFRIIKFKYGYITNGLLSKLCARKLVI